MKPVDRVTVAHEVLALLRLSQEMGFDLVPRPESTAPISTSSPMKPVEAKTLPATASGRGAFPLNFNLELPIQQRFRDWAASIPPGREVHNGEALTVLGIDREVTCGDLIRMTHMMQREGYFELAGADGEGKAVTSHGRTYRHTMIRGKRHCIFRRTVFLPAR